MPQTISVRTVSFARGRPGVRVRICFGAATTQTKLSDSGISERPRNVGGNPGL
jgi:hypothetical protein